MTLFIPIGIIIAAGLTMLSSISEKLFFSQSTWIAIGALLIPLFQLFRRQGFLRSKWFSWGVYSAGVLLLTLAYFFAPVIRNTRSWLVVGPFQFQPVELVKMGLILVFASYFAKRHVAIARPKHLAASFFIFGIPAFFTLLQPDLGSATVLFGIWFGFLLVSGLPRRWVIAFFMLLAIGALLGWSIFLEDYHRERILGVVYPERDALGVNYSTIQSKIAIGSGGFWGKGYGQGTQTQLGFLTEPGTDFIFSGLVEEWGFLGGVVVLGAFLALEFYILRRALAARGNFEKFLCLGTAIMFGIHFFVNVGSATGIVPVIGITFPFLSYGGSSLMANAALVAMIYALEEHA